MGFLIGMALIAATVAFISSAISQQRIAAYYPPPFDDIYGFDPDYETPWDAPSLHRHPGGRYPQPYFPTNPAAAHPGGYWPQPYSGPYYPQQPGGYFPPALHPGPIYSPDFRYVLNPYTGQWMEQ